MHPSVLDASSQNWFFVFLVFFVLCTMFSLIMAASRRRGCKSFDSLRLGGVGSIGILFLLIVDMTYGEILLNNFVAELTQDVMVTGTTK